MTGAIKSYGPASDLDNTILRATTVAVGRRALAITGASGTGKSSLALQMIAFGAELVSDDQTRVEAREGVLVASPTETCQGMIEARGLGLLQLGRTAATPLIALLDLEKTESERLPPQRVCDVLGVKIPLLYAINGPHFAAALYLYLKGERSPDE